MINTCIGVYFIIIINSIVDINGSEIINRMTPEVRNISNWNNMRDITVFIDKAIRSNTNGGSGPIIKKTKGIINILDSIRDYIIVL